MRRRPLAARRIPIDHTVSQHRLPLSLGPERIEDIRSEGSTEASSAPVPAGDAYQSGPADFADLTKAFADRGDTIEALKTT